MPSCCSSAWRARPTSSSTSGLRGAGKAGRRESVERRGSTRRGVRYLGPPIADEQRSDRGAVLEVGGSHLTAGGRRRLHPKGHALTDDRLPQELASCPRERLVRRAVAVPQARRGHAGQRDLLLWRRPLACISTCETQAGVGVRRGGWIAPKIGRRHTHDDERVAAEHALYDTVEHGHCAGVRGRGES
eukprot:scaffold114271_cov69-Phaeocystis_antarctica.AAC.2